MKIACTHTHTSRSVQTGRHGFVFSESPKLALYTSIVLRRRGAEKGYSGNYREALLCIVCVCCYSLSFQHKQKKNNNSNTTNEKEVLCTMICRMETRREMREEEEAIQKEQTSSTELSRWNDNIILIVDWRRRCVIVVRRGLVLGDFCVTGQ